MKIKKKLRMKNKLKIYINILDPKLMKEVEEMMMTIFNSDMVITRVVMVNKAVITALKVIVM